MVLSRARVLIGGPLSKEAQDKIDAVTQRPITRERMDELTFHAKRLCEGFARILDGPSREDDGLELLVTALESLDSSNSFSFRRKTVQNIRARFRMESGFLDYDGVATNT